MLLEMGMNFRDDDPAFGIEDLGRSLDRRRGVERKVENGAANRDDPSIKLPRSHRNHSLSLTFLPLARRRSAGKATTTNNNRAFVDIFAN